MEGWSFGKDFRLGSGIDAVPCSCVVVSGGRDDDCGHDGGDVEIRPRKHLLEHGFSCEFRTNAFHTIFHGNPALIVDWLRLVAVVVCLHDKPSFIWKFIGSVDSIGVSLDDCSLIGANSRDDVVDRRGDSLIFESFEGSLVGALLLEHFSEQPAGGNGVVFDDADQIFRKGFGPSCIDVDRKSSKSDTCQCEHASHNGVNSE